jgi:hypothetical protein
MHAGAAMGLLQGVGRKKKNPGCPAQEAGLGVRHPSKKKAGRMDEADTTERNFHPTGRIGWPPEMNEAAPDHAGLP